MGKPTFRYLLDRLGDVKTQSDLEDVKYEIEGFLPLDRFEETQDFDYNTAETETINILDIK
jgi:hypothetical protein